MCQPLSPGVFGPGASTLQPLSAYPDGPEAPGTGALAACTSSTGATTPQPLCWMYSRPGKTAETCPPTTHQPGFESGWVQGGTKPQPLSPDVSGPGVGAITHKPLAWSTPGPAGCSTLHQPLLSHQSRAGAPLHKTLGTLTQGPGSHRTSRLRHVVPALGWPETSHGHASPIFYRQPLMGCFRTLHLH